jgi:metal-responsive CopG/Arc/MetJ family transcriptional regulator
MAKVMISVPEDLLARVDDKAAKQTRSRSALIRDALQRYLAEDSAEDQRSAIRHLTRTFAGLKANPEELVRAERAR